MKTITSVNTHSSTIIMQVTVAVGYAIFFLNSMYMN